MTKLTLGLCPYTQRKISKPKKVNELFQIKNKKVSSLFAQREGHEISFSCPPAAAHSHLLRWRYPRDVPSPAVKALDTDGNLGSFIPAAFTWLWNMSARTNRALWVVYLFTEDESWGRVILSSVLHLFNTSTTEKGLWEAQVPIIYLLVSYETAGKAKQLLYKGNGCLQ